MLTPVDGELVRLQPCRRQQRPQRRRSSRRRPCGTAVASWASTCRRSGGRRRTRASPSPSASTSPCRRAAWYPAPQQPIRATTTRAAFLAATSHTSTRTGRVRAAFARAHARGDHLCATRRAGQHHTPGAVGAAHVATHVPQGRPRRAADQRRRRQPRPHDAAAVPADEPAPLRKLRPSRAARHAAAQRAGTSV